MGQDIGRPAQPRVVRRGHLVEGPNQRLRLDTGTVCWPGAAASVTTEGRGRDKPRHEPGPLAGGDAGHDDEVLKHQQPRVTFNFQLYYNSFFKSLIWSKSMVTKDQLCPK